MRIAPLLLLLTAIYTQADFQAAREAYQAGEYAKAAKAFTESANQGDVRAQTELGQMYERGEGVQADYGRARQMFNYAASYFGDPDAQLNLARMYYQGEGGERDPRQAARWANLSAEKGNIAAQALLGHLLFEGEGVQRQPVIGLMFLTIASERCSPNDQWIRDLQEEAFSLATETERRTATDFAEVVRWLVEEVHEEAEKVVLVMDNLNTHRIASLYEAFPPERARRIAERLEIHHTPKHGSWLNMAEVELSVLARQCLDRRIPDQATLAREVTWLPAVENRGEGVFIQFQKEAIDAW